MNSYEFAKDTVIYGLSEYPDSKIKELINNGTIVDHKIDWTYGGGYDIRLSVIPSNTKHDYTSHYKPPRFIEIERVIFSDPATIIVWKDGKKTVVKCSENDIYVPETGFMMAYMKRLIEDANGEGSFHKLMKKWVPRKKEKKKKEKVAKVLGHVESVEETDDGVLIKCELEDGVEIESAVKNLKDDTTKA